jgi:hypothetical protein
MNTDTHGKKIIFRLRRGKASLTHRLRKQRIASEILGDVVDIK